MFSQASSIMVNSNFFFFFIFCVTALILLLSFRFKPWCSCEICETFLNSSWSLKYNNLCDWYSHLLAKSPTGTIHVHVLGNIITANCRNVEYMLKTRFDNYPKGGQFSAILGDLLGRGIFNVDGDLWRTQRKIASLELGSVCVRSYAFDIVTSEIRSRLIPLLSSHQQSWVVLDLQDVFRRLSFDSICKFSFGVDPCCLDLSLPISEFATAFDLASKLSAERAVTASPFIWKLKKFFNLGSEAQLRSAVKAVHELADGVIKYRREHGSLSSSDLLSRFIGTIDDDKLLRDIVVSFLLAGRDTVASALTSFFWLLMENPESVELIRKESSAVMGTEIEKVASFDQLREMHYLQAAVHESIRLFPPVQFDSKFCEEDDFLPDGTFVARGTRVSYHPYAMGRMDAIWGPDCTEFKPERWLKGGIFKTENPFKFPVFQAGPRVCLGKEMSVVEIKVVALSLIRRFDFQAVVPGRAPKFLPGLTATVRGGLPVIVRGRSSS